jgi:putative tricarboxylic transport membrane protein
MVGDSPVKTLLACVLGLALATVGVDANSGVYRFTFGDLHLSDGIQFVVVVIGLFSISEILLMLEQSETGAQMLKASGRAWFNLRELSMVKWTIVRSAPLGFLVGVLPGAGASIASAITYMIEKNINDTGKTFGKGDVRGIAAPESANNAAAGGAFIPMLTLGVPGSGTTAVMMGALTLYNINPGPTLFTDQAELVWGLIASMFIANVMLLLMNIPMVGVFARMLAIPNWILVPAIAAISLVGVYSIHATTFDLVLMTALGVVGYVLRKLDFPMAPLILGFVLGDMMEQNLRRALAISNGDTSVLYGSGITVAIWAAAAFMLVVPLWLRWKRNNKLIEVK